MKTISIVDDNLMMREFLRSFLSKSYEVKTYATGQEALHAMSETKPDILILDQMMAGLSGLELLKAMKSSFTYNKIPVILLSGDSKSDTRIACLKAGANDFIAKPFNPEELSIRIQKALN